ncbi:MAG: ABC transporter substrate-binding protein [Betaproteobacteria bacterium]|nr:ABC transporter substrate-binding protein [Betaproteobacteria bacterium]
MKAFAVALLLCSAAALAQPPVLIGGSVARTGQLADLSGEYVKGLELWQADVNARGGLLGRSVELRLADDESGARRAAEITSELIAEGKVDLLIGPFGSPATLAAGVVAEREQRILVNATGAADNVHKRALRYVFQLLAPASEQALPVLKLADRLGAHTITVFARGGAGGAMDRLRQEVKLAGLGLIESGALPPPTLMPANYPPLIAKIDRASVVLVFDNTLRLADIVRAMKHAGFRPRAFVSPDVLQADYIKRIGVDAEYSIGLSAYEPRARTRGNADFVRSFEARHKRPPELYAACGWATGQLIEAAAARSGSIETAPLREAFAQLETETVIGAYKVDANGAQRAATAMLVQILKGKREVIWPENFRSADAVLTPPAWGRQ